MKTLIKGVNFGISMLLILAAMAIAYIAIPTFGNKALIVRSGSMQPAIKVGDLVVVQTQRGILTPLSSAIISSYRKGDIVAFSSEKNAKLFTTHRIVGKEVKDGKVFYQTKGDANNAPDNNLVAEESVIGKTVVRLPYFGRLFAFAKSNVGFPILVIFPALLVIILEIVNIYKEIRRQNRIIEVPAPKENFAGLKIIIPVFLSVMVMHNAFAYFSDTETSTGNIFSAAESFGEGGCPVCEVDETIVIDQNVTIDFNTATPTYSGDTDLQLYFSFEKSGPTADTWKAIFTLENKKLLIKNGATITVTSVPATGTNRFVPGIEINACELEIEAGGKISVISQNEKAGDIFIQIGGNVVINGEIRNQVTGTLGLPGRITLSSICGNMTTGTSSLIIIDGVDPGGNNINVVNCCAGDITLNGLIMSRAHAHSGDLTQNRPNIRVAAFEGTVTINANTAEPFFDEHNYGGGLRDIYPGLLSWVTTNSNPGKVEVQAKGDITISGHGTDPTGAVRESFGAIAAIATASNAPGGLVDVRSIGGSIIGNDRAFDVSGRNRLATNFAHISLFAKNNITTSRLGANNNFNPVVDASSPSVGDKGGTNELRAYTGGITNGTSALISASVPAGSGTVQGVNLLTSCTGVTNNGSVTPSDGNPADDSGQCSPDSPTPLFAECSDFGIDCFCSQFQESMVVINEVYYDVGAGKGNEGNTAEPDEWLELYNNSTSAINLKNWTITDNDATRVITTADITIPANGFALISKNLSTWTSFWGNPPVVQIALGQKIGNGLADDGDRLILKNNLGITIDAMSYGTDATVLSPSAADVTAGHSLERDPDGTDTDNNFDFVDRLAPTPGT